ncbi:hypothetical protein J5834_02230 [bacterium]|nr:hypothetical protein [bacterium]
MKKVTIIMAVLLAAFFFVSCGGDEGDDEGAGGSCTVEGAFQCSGNTVQISQQCQNGTWINFQQCQNGCNTATGKCNEGGNGGSDTGSTEPTDTGSTEPTDTGDTGTPDTGDTQQSGGTDTCVEIYQCVADCTDQTCFDACIANGTQADQNLFVAMYSCWSNNCANASTSDEFTECAKANCLNETEACGLGFPEEGNPAYPAPYGHMDVNVGASYIITNESSLDQSMVTMSYFATGNIGNGTLQPAGAQGAYYYAMHQGTYVGVVQSPFANNGQTVLNPVVMMQFADTIAPGSVSAGLTQSDDVIILIFDSDSQGNTTCYHGFAVGNLTVNSINLAAGASGSISISGSQLEIYSSENAPLYGGNITSDLNSPQNPWVPCAAQ